MAETKPLTAYAMHDVLLRSDLLTIGKHAWRIAQSWHRSRRSITDGTTGISQLIETPTIVVDHGSRRLGERFEYGRQVRDGPSYGFSDGQSHGPARSLRTLCDTCP